MQDTISTTDLFEGAWLLTLDIPLVTTVYDDDRVYLYFDNRDNQAELALREWRRTSPTVSAKQILYHYKRIKKLVWQARVEVEA